MKKIPTIFKRDENNRQLVTSEINPAAQWVFDGEGIATHKLDGTCCLVKDGKLFKRREVKKGKPVPPDFMQADYDPITGKTVGWVPVDLESKEDRWYAEAWGTGLAYRDGTYELIGPKVQGNPERYDYHALMAHAGAGRYVGVPRTYEGFAEYLMVLDAEGIVFHHEDGRMAKIKKRDFGIKWPGA